MFGLIEFIENIFNRPFGILLIIAGLIFLLIVVLFKLSDIESKIAQMTGIVLGAVLIISGSLVHLMPSLFRPVPGVAVPKQELGNEEKKLGNEEKKLGNKEKKLGNEEKKLGNEEKKLGNEGRHLDSQTGVLERSDDTPQRSAKEAAAETVKDNNKKSSLRFAPVTEFEFLWNDKESGTKQKVAFYKPVPPVGYKIFGYYAQSRPGNTGDGILAVKSVSPPEAENVLAYPIKYERIWYDSDDDSGSAGAVWRPIPPPGYRCLGDVATTGLAEPDRREVVCVKESLTAEAQLGELIWDNRGKDAMNDIRVYSVIPKNPKQGLDLKLFQGYGRKWYRKPGGDSLFVLKRQ